MHLGIFPTNYFAIEPNFISFNGHYTSLSPDHPIRMLRYSTCLASGHQVGQKKRPPGFPRGRHRITGGLQPVFQYGRRLETDGAGRANGNGGAGLGISTLARLARAYGERAETRDLKSLIFPYGLGNTVESGVDGLSGSEFADLGVFSDGID